MKHITPVLFYACLGVLMSMAAVAAPQSASPAPRTPADTQPAADAKPATVPIYHVNVVERTIRAVNYQYRSLPTPIDFTGTVLLPKGKGMAVVESKQGRTEIDTHFDNLTAPTAFGPEYLTYVLWALTPDGRPHNLGEVVANSGNHAGLHVTTSLQAFAMIVTAEPYSAVRQPSDVVVLENQIRPDTVGINEQVNARYELLPRGQYSYQVPDAIEAAAAAAGPKVSMGEYEELLEIYQAQNAVNIARAAGADQYANTTFTKAQTLLNEAQQRHARKADRTLAIQEAREAAQTAEDARAIALQAQQQEQITKAQAEADTALKAKASADAALQQAQAAATQAREQMEAAQAQLETERAARERAEQDANTARDRAAQLQAEVTARAAAAPAPPAPPPAQDQGRRQDTAQATQRSRMLAQLNAIAPARDTPRGLAVTIPDSSFHGASLREFATSEVARISQIVAASPGLRVEVDGNSDTEAGGAEALQRAAVVGHIFESHGLTRYAVSVRGLADSRPVVSNHSPGGAIQNRRVEILISGDAIGATPLWEQSSIH
jgi:flagellar motor protein MotB